MNNEYQPVDIIYILMDAMSAQILLDDWLHHNYKCDLHLRRSVKNKGKVVIETKNLMWANRIIKWHKYEQLIYKHLKQ